MSRIGIDATKAQIEHAVNNTWQKLNTQDDTVSLGTDASANGGTAVAVGASSSAQRPTATAVGGNSEAREQG
jgi:hypothetical protein